MLHQYCAYTRDTHQMRLAYALISQYSLDYEPHANRTRFWVHSDSPIHTLVALQFKCVDSEQDHAQGI